MSEFRDARHWWQKHLEHMAREIYGYAQGTFDTRRSAPEGVTMRLRRLQKAGGC